MTVLTGIDITDETGVSIIDNQAFTGEWSGSDIAKNFKTFFGSFNTITIENAYGIPW